MGLREMVVVGEEVVLVWGKERGAGRGGHLYVRGWWLTGG